MKRKIKDWFGLNLPMVLFILFFLFFYFYYKIR